MPGVDVMWENTAKAMSSRPCTAVRTSYQKERMETKMMGEKKSGFSREAEERTRRRKRKRRRKKEERKREKTKEKKHRKATSRAQHAKLTSTMASLVVGKVTFNMIKSSALVLCTNASVFLVMVYARLRYSSLRLVVVKGIDRITALTP